VGGGFGSHPLFYIEGHVMQINQEQINAELLQKYRFTNISDTKMFIHPNKGLPLQSIALKPGEFIDLNAMQWGTSYSHAIQVFKDCKPVFLTMTKITGSESQAQPETKEQEQPDAGSEEEPPVEDEIQNDQLPAVDPVALKSEIKDLETEYRSSSTPSDRKQEIKLSIRDMKNKLKSLK
jgi:hypothetical protein